MTQYVYRSPFQEAGHRTESIGKSAAAVTPHSRPNKILPCETAKPSLTSSENSKSHTVGCCNSRDNLYTTPYMVLPCCPYPTETKEYLSPCKVLPYYSTPSQYKTAVANRINNEAGCCESTCSPLVVLTDQNPTTDDYQATVSGNVSGSGITQKGFVWSESSGPTISGNNVVVNSVGPGQFSALINFPQIGNDLTYYARAYAIGCNGVVVYGNEISFLVPYCFVKGTLILMADGTQKPVEGVTYEDELAVWNFDEGRKDSSYPLWIKVVQTSNTYNKLSFSDGTVLKTVHKHRIFNKNRGMFTYPMDDEMTPLGTVTVNASGENIVLVAKEVITEDVEYYNIMPAQHMNLYANSILASWRFNNIYPIADMKFVKDAERSVIPLTAYEGVPEEYYNAMRLGEQPKIPVKKSIDWVKRMLANKV